MSTMINGKDGGIATVLTRFREIWVIDAEFVDHQDGTRTIVCIVAKELVAGRTVRLWRHDLSAWTCPPFDVGPTTLVVSFYAPAELGCFERLGWNFPVNNVDLYAEHRVLTNGLNLPLGNGLLGAVAHWVPEAQPNFAHKSAMRGTILDSGSDFEKCREEILAYCEEDVDQTIALFQILLPKMSFEQALLRGQYMAATAKMERNGIPIDVSQYQNVTSKWAIIKTRLISEMDAPFRLYEGSVFKEARFEALLQRMGIVGDWPRLQTGILDLKDDTFKWAASRWSGLSQVRELRQSLARMRMLDLQIGSDGFSRCMLSPFASATGRNQPSSKRFAFGPAKMFRRLIKPPEGFSLAYADVSSQEIAIAAGLSGDQPLKEAYEAGDPYLAFAKQVKLAPNDADRNSHPRIRDLCKATMLGLNYGLGYRGLAQSLGLTPQEANELVQLHKRTYRRFWSWLENYVSDALLHGEASSVFGWRRKVRPFEKYNSLLNFPMQANGAEMLRVSAIAAVEAGIFVCAPIHDAFLIMAPTHEIDEKVDQMKSIMMRSGEIVTGGVQVSVQAQIYRYPDCFGMNEDSPTWNKILEISGSIH